MKQANHFGELRELLLNLQKNMRELVPLIDEMQAFKAGIDADILKRLHVVDSLSSTITRELKLNFCEDCGALPVWVRSTQFSGKFLFCDKCARKHPDFTRSDKRDTYFWKKVKPQGK